MDFLDHAGMRLCFSKCRDTVSGHTFSLRVNKLASSLRPTRGSLRVRRPAADTWPLCLPADAYKSPHSPFYQLPPSVQRHPPDQLLLAPTPPALQKLLGEPHPDLAGLRGPPAGFSTSPCAARPPNQSPTGSGSVLPLSAGPMYSSTGWLLPKGTRGQDWGAAGFEGVGPGCCSISPVPGMPPENHLARVHCTGLGRLCWG